MQRVEVHAAHVSFPMQLHTRAAVVLQVLTGSLIACAAAAGSGRCWR